MEEKEKKDRYPSNNASCPDKITGESYKTLKNQITPKQC